jgi:hypothetical protein
MGLNKRIYTQSCLMDFKGVFSLKFLLFSAIDSDSIEPIKVF